MFSSFQASFSFLVPNSFSLKPGKSCNLRQRRSLSSEGLRQGGTAKLWENPDKRDGLDEVRWSYIEIRKERSQ